MILAECSTVAASFINGNWQHSNSVESVEVFNPATAEILARITLADIGDVGIAVVAASAAFPAWRRTPPQERIQYLFRLKRLLEEPSDEISRLITQENGKTLAEARAELQRGIENVEVACGIPILMQGDNLEDIASGIDEIMIRQPLGVTAAITPFNFLKPTVLGNINPENTLTTTEIFGSVLTVREANDLDEAIGIISKSAYGNAASIFTSNGNSARKFRYEIPTGNVGIISGVAAPMAYFPFSGWKDSFLGVLHGQGHDGVAFYTDKKVSIERWPKEWSRKF